MECNWEEYLDITLLIISYFMNTWLVPNPVVLCFHNSLVMEEAAQVLEIETLIANKDDSLETTTGGALLSIARVCYLSILEKHGNQSSDL